MLNLQFLAILTMSMALAGIAQGQDALTNQLRIDSRAPIYNRGDKNLLTILRTKREKTGDNSVSITYAPPGQAVSKLSTFEEKWTSSVCAADLIVVGTVDARKTSLSSDQSALVTDYSLGIVTIVKSKAQTQFLPDHVVVTARGGILRTSDGVIEENGAVGAPLAPNNTYLLFLNKFASYGSFEVPLDLPPIEVVDNNKVRPMAQQWFTDSLSRFVAPFTFETLQRDIETRATKCAD